MKVTLRSVKNITPYPGNPRFNDGPAVEKVIESIRAFGFRQPIVIDSDGVILAGHTRFKAALELGMPKVPVHVADLSDEEAKAYRIADNRTAEEAEWDVPGLADEISALMETGFDPSILGFDALEIDSILKCADGVEINSPGAAEAEWNGMPEYGNRDETSKQRIVVHFATDKDVQDFGNLIGQSLTEKTRSIWFPPAEIGRTADKEFVDDETT